MKMKWTDQKSKEPKEVTAPLSLAISAFAPVADIRRTWIPALRRSEDDDGKESVLLIVNLAEGLGGLALAQIFGQVGNKAPDVWNVQRIKDHFDAMQQLQEAEIVLAYHDRSDWSLYNVDRNDVC